MLEFKNISYTYHAKEGEPTAVENLNFTVEDGQFVSVIGPSGCGKTTILSLAAGLLSPSAGEVVRGNGECGYMLQRDALF
ncbi:MAG: ATP-binding cassette domain-containing protein, partial [Clostridia bacterium]|nr:ATP-binding cassette domain-containing protein [Clostridia bacterium]